MAISKERIPTALLASPKVKKHLPHDLVRRCRTAVGSAADAGFARNPSATALLETLYATGMRVTELVNLDVTDLDMEKGISPAAPAIAAAGLRRSTTGNRGDDAHMEEGRPGLVVKPDEMALFLNHCGQRLTPRPGSSSSAMSRK